MELRTDLAVRATEVWQYSTSVCFSANCTGYDKVDLHCNSVGTAGTVDCVGADCAGDGAVPAELCMLP
jgi:hypothetical protein